MADYMYLVQMDIPAALEDEFNRIYDTQHVPNIVKAPGFTVVPATCCTRPTRGAWPATRRYTRSTRPMCPKAQAGRLNPKRAIGPAR